jgi:hypothetical protein
MFMSNCGIRVFNGNGVYGGLGLMMVVMSICGGVPQRRKWHSDTQ